MRTNRAPSAGPAKTALSSQNGRGGTFFVMQNQQLSESIGKLIGVGTPGAVSTK